jgi:RHS repeat-associated protein
MGRSEYNAAWQIVETRKTTTASDHPESLHPESQYIWSLRYIDAPVLRDENHNDDDDCTDDGDGDERLYYLTDVNMNLTALVETDGDVAERYAYDPYGRVRFYGGGWAPGESSSYGNAILYCGYWRDAETGLYHVRNRMYHPLLGRWLQRNPLGYVDGMSLCAYVGSSVTVMSDPFGLEKRWTLITWIDNVNRNGVIGRQDTYQVTDPRWHHLSRSWSVVGTETVFTPYAERPAPPTSVAIQLRYDMPLGEASSANDYVRSWGMGNGRIAHYNNYVWGRFTEINHSAAGHGVRAAAAVPGIAASVAGKLRVLKQLAPFGQNIYSSSTTWLWQQLGAGTGAVRIIGSLRQARWLGGPSIIPTIGYVGIAVGTAELITYDYCVAEYLIGGHFMDAPRHWWWEGTGETTITLGGDAQDPSMIVGGFGWGRGAITLGGSTLIDAVELRSRPGTPVTLLGPDGLILSGAGFVAGDPTGGLWMPAETQKRKPEGLEG